MALNDEDYDPTLEYGTLENFQKLNPEGYQRWLRAQNSIYTAWLETNKYISPPSAAATVPAPLSIEPAPSYQNIFILAVAALVIYALVK